MDGVTSRTSPKMHLTCPLERSPSLTPVWRKSPDDGPPLRKAECRRPDAFKLWCWKRLLRVPWTARSNQSILKDISPEYSLEGLMLKLKLQ